MKKQTDLAVKLRDIASRAQADTADTTALTEAAETFEENARLVELAAHPECPADLGFGGTLAWHRDKINKLRQRPLA
jgi:hypothetical protein